MLTGPKLINFENSGYRAVISARYFAYMKKFFLLTITAINLINPIFSAHAQSDELKQSIVISEIAAYETSDLEWIEIYNTSSESIDIDAMSFFENETNHGITVYSGGALLAPHTYGVIANKATDLAQKYPLYKGVIFDSSWTGLKEEGEEVGLKDASGNFVEHFTYPLAQNTSLERIDLSAAASNAENWKSHPSGNSIGEAYNPLAQATENVENIPDSSLEEEVIQPIVVAQNNTPTTPLNNSPFNVSSTNQPPTARITKQSGALIGQEKVTVNFDGSDSVDPEGKALSYFWDFGDGKISSAKNPPQHSYLSPGVYIVSLTVVDELGVADVQRTSVQVLNTPQAVPAVANATTQSTTATQKQIAETNTGVKSVASSKISVNPCTVETNQSSVFDPLRALVELRLTFDDKNSGAISVASKTAASSTTTKTSTTAKATTTKAAAKSPYNNGDLSSSIKITELLPKPNEGADAEWIELMNTSDVPVNLGNWMVADTTKKAPHKIADNVTVEPKGFYLINRSESKIALNDGADSVYLFDYRGQLIDSVSYEKAQKGSSYALISTTRPPDGDRVASLDEPPSQRTDASWQWTDKPTPGEANPSLTTVRGTVSKLSENPEEQAMQIILSSGSLATLAFDSAKLDPDIAELALTEGTEIEAIAQQKSSDTYELERVTNVTPRTEVPTQKKSYTFIWIALALLATTIGLNLKALLARYREYKKENTEDE